MSETIIELPASKPLVAAYLKTLGANDQYAALLGERMPLSGTTIYSYQADGEIRALLPVTGNQTMELWPMARTNNAGTWAARVLLYKALESIKTRDECMIINARVPVADEDLWEIYLDANFDEKGEREHDVTMSLVASGITRAQAALAGRSTPER